MVTMPRTSKDSGGVPYCALASELLRALRAKRSRPGFSRFLGYRSNIAQRWESQECWPTASRFFALCTRLRHEPRQLVSAFLRRSPPWLEGADLTCSEGVGALLTELRGRTPVQVISERAGFNRFSVARWLAGTADPKLPEFLAVVEACSRRSLDFIATLVDPATLPSVAVRWGKLELLREGAYKHPWSHAVLRALELDGARGSANHVDFLMERTGMKKDDVEASLRFLVESGQAKKTRSGYRPTQTSVVDTGGDPARARALRVAWSRNAVERLANTGTGDVGYSLFAVSKDDLQRVRQLQQDFLRQMQTIIGASQHCECVALYCAQLLDLGAHETAAPVGPS